MLQKIVVTLTVLASFISLFPAQPVSAQSPAVLITELQTGFIDGAGLESPKHEFIELTNVSPGFADMADWRLEYLSAAHNGEAAPTSVLVTYSGRLPLNGKALFSHVGYVPGLVDRVFGEGDASTSGLLAKSGGHVRLMNGTTMIDCVAWGSAVAIDGCDKVTATAPAGHTIQRPISEGGSYDKSLGVKNLTPPNPQGGDLYDLAPQDPPVDPPVDPPAEPEPEPEPEVPAPVTPVCKGIRLSEILPNPAGDDAVGEFIELYNQSSQEQSLLGCRLRIGSAGKLYAFTASDKLAANQYKAFYFSTTGLQLTNSGGEVRLLSDDPEQIVSYPSAADDRAWALIGGVWQVTSLPTPNAPNALPAVGSEGEDSSASAADCPAGKFRNPETGRCKNIETDNELAPCAVGQERNSETNRCRKVTAASATLTPCEPGEERNPATNRCRKITTSQTTLKACTEGQERNPETNRCRKVTTVSANAGGTGSDNSRSIQNYKILGIVLLLVFAYAVYEYRQDIRNKYEAIRARLLSKGAKP